MRMEACSNPPLGGCANVVDDCSILPGPSVNSVQPNTFTRYQFQRNHVSALTPLRQATHAMATKCGRDAQREGNQIARKVVILNAGGEDASTLLSALISLLLPHQPPQPLPAYYVLFRLPSLRYTG